MFQAKRSGWKRLAASLLLLPGLSAVGAEMLHVLGTARAEPKVAAPASAAKADSAAKLMAQARAAYEKGDYTSARELAEMARDTGNASPYGADSPEQLLADIQKKSSARTPARVKATTEDPRVLVKKAREALDGGRIDAAQDLAHQAESNGRNTSWGLFDDTPASIMKDVQKARSKRDRAEADRLLTSARNLYEKRTSTDEVRAANLDRARSLCLQAGQLHGPYSMWDFGDRPQSLIKDIDSARSKIKVTVRRPEPKPAAKDPLGTAMKPKAQPKVFDPYGQPDENPLGYNPLKPGTGVNGGTVASKQPNPVKTVSNDQMPNLLEPPENVGAGEPANPKKAQVVERMKQAQNLQRDHDYVKARQVLADAAKQNASFGLDEDTPEIMLQSLMSSAQKHINVLCRDAHEQMLKKTAADVAVAERKLAEADAIATGLGLDRWAIKEHGATLKAIKSNTSAVATMNPPAIVDPMEPRKVNPPDLILPPDMELPPLIVTKPAPPDQGTELLRQAHNEMKAKAFDNARKIATQVLNGNYQCKDDAQDLLRSIDAAERGQREDTALRTYRQGIAAMQQGNYAQALSVFKQIDPSLLPESKRADYGRNMALAAKGAEKPSGLVHTGGPKDPLLPLPADKTGADNLLKQQEHMMELQFQKLRAEGLQTEANATARFGKGETDIALTDLVNFIARVKASGIEPTKVTLLVRPIESRIERLKVLKHQQDFLTKEAKDLRNFRNQMTQDSLHSAHKKEEVARLMKDFHRLVDEHKLQDAYKTAMVARELDPEDPGTASAMKLAHLMMRKKNWDDLQKDNEQTRYDMGHDAHTLGQSVGGRDPLKFDLETFNRIRSRSTGIGGISTLRPRTEKERQIESQLSTKTISLNFKGTPLDEVVGYFATYTGMNFDIDTKSLGNEGIDVKMPITATLNTITLKSALGVVLDKANLLYIVDKEVVRITTRKGARGKLVQRTIGVADLVIPVQNHKPSSISNLEKQLENSLLNSRPQLPGASTTPFTPQMGLGAGTGTPTGMPSSGGTLQNVPTGPQVTKSSATGTIEEALIRLITSSVQPDTWDAMGGAGRIEYYPLGMALVINQTPDVIEEVFRLLEALRQLQDLEIAIEVRMITLAETFYERIGLDFSMNVETHNDRAVANLLTNPGNSTNNLTNIINARGKKVIGLQAPGVPTPDLDLPIRATSFTRAIPPFGQYGNDLTTNGGLALGLAFLSDIQVQMFLEAAQGDRRTNVMQAPKLTMFNGQSADISINDQQFFLTGVSVTSINGVLIFTPQNNPFPLGVQLNMQPVVSGDRRFVRLNIQQSMTNLASATVPLFPITTIVTPVFEGGSQGQPVPFTQYIQQPTFSTISVSTTVVVPDGGTVLLGGLKTLSEGRNEFGPPVLSKIPYISRLFRNVGYGREAQSLMMMVTPRIIINREEQERQTGIREGEEVPQ